MKAKLKGFGEELDGTEVDISDTLIFRTPPDYPCPECGEMLPAHLVHNHDKALKEAVLAAQRQLLIELLEQREVYDTHEFRYGTANATEEAVPIVAIQAMLDRLNRGEG